MYSILLIIYSIILFILFNVFLYTLNYFLLFSFIILFCYVLYNLSKIENNRLYNISIVYIIFLVIFTIYWFNFSNIEIEKNKYNFLETNRNILGNSNIKNLELTYSIEEFNECNEKWCDILKYYTNDINLIKGYLNENYNILWIVRIDKEINNLIRKKKILNEKWIKTADYKINFNLDNLIKDYLITRRSKNIKYLNMKNNFFINKKQYINYIDNYYYKVYELIQYNNIELIRNLENEYSRNNIWKIIINRKNIYDFLIVPPKTLYSDIKIIKTFEDNIDIINR